MLLSFTLIVLFSSKTRHRKKTIWFREKKAQQRIFAFLERLESILTIEIEMAFSAKDAIQFHLQNFTQLYWCTEQEVLPNL